MFDHPLIKKSLDKQGSRELYQIEISGKSKKPTFKLYYERYLNKFDFYWKLIYLLPRIVTVDTKLRVFQYKILNDILYVNTMIFKFRKVVLPLCSFCKAEDETYIRLFYRCRKTSIFWIQLQEYLFLILLVFHHRVSFSDSQMVSQIINSL